MTGVFSKRFSRKECFRCLVDATPSRTELQVSPCWQLLTSQVVWFFPFFSLLLLVFLLSFLSCIRTKTGFLSQWGLGGLNADTWEFFWDGFTPLLLKSLFLLFKAFNVDFHFALGVDYLPADIIVYPMIGQIAQLFEEKKMYLLLVLRFD